MATKIYVGNLSWSTTDETLRDAFLSYGNVLDSIVMRDRDTGRSRGFGFVTFATSHEADAAISGLNETELDGRRIKVNMANARPQGGGGGGYGGGQNYNQNYGQGYGGGYSAPPQQFGTYGGQAYGVPPQPQPQYGAGGPQGYNQGYAGGPY